MNEGKIIGVLGTVILHLLLGIIFMSTKLSSIVREDPAEFLVEFQPDMEFIEDDIVEEPVSLEELFEDDDRFTDIIRNIANEEGRDINAADYIDRVKEEMIAEGKLGEDNYIDEQKKLLEAMDEGDTAFDTAEDDSTVIEKEISANELAAQYDGPTRVYYDLANRYHLRMPIPIYKCENSGIIIINITVNPGGDITSYRFNEDMSSTLDECLLEAALSAVRRTSFNPDPAAQKKQEGTISYQFVEQ